MPVANPLAIDDFERLPVWILDLDSRRAFLFSERGGAILKENQLFQSPLLPGLSIRIADLFDRR